MPRIMVIPVLLLLSACCNGQQLDPPTVPLDCAEQLEHGEDCSLNVGPPSWDRFPTKRRDLN